MAPRLQEARTSGADQLDEVPVPPFLMELAVPALMVLTLAIGGALEMGQRRGWWDL